MIRPLFLLTCLLAVVGYAEAAKVEKLLMPGLLVEAHADEEETCSSCHGTFSGIEQSTLCRDCHEKVDADIRNQVGFHGRSPSVRGAQCRQCHSDHQGRSADIVGLTASLFDHRFTDFQLKDAHGLARCRDCHETSKAFSEAPAQCNDCHQADDVHRGEMGESCQDCHSAQSWKKAEFDHEETEFPLQGEHAKVACSACHATTTYDQTPTECSACHGLQDVHGGLFGKECDGCHNPKKWDQSRFKHDRETDFALTGKHGQVSCHSCHTEKTRGLEIATSCSSCHAASDVHQGRFGKDCASCHTSKTWRKQRFEHDADTDFPLRGVHREVGCDSCHAEDQTRSSKTTEARSRCVDCHRASDVHKGLLGQRCDQCHSQQDWAQDNRFDHDLSRFPLVGLHAIVPCEECHLSSRYRGTPSECAECHADSDPHEGYLGADCSACHSPGGWWLWSFDHDKQTDFELTGQHRNQACDRCHQQPLDKTDRACVSCHRNDDAHDGRFGSNCGACHSSDSFDEIRMGAGGR